MPKYLLSMYQPDGVTPPPEVLEPVMREIAAIRKELEAAGAWVFAGGLHPTSTSTVVRLKDGDLLTTDGPYVEGKEHICLLYTSPSPRDRQKSRMPSSA